MVKKSCGLGMCAAQAYQPAGYTSLAPPHGGPAEEPRPRFLPRSTGDVFGELEWTSAPKSDHPIPI